ncbi:MAG: cadmium-translocating P-type ATPase [Oscillospiraceae bacterium]|jgi:Cd2+/Zn2+-exporting ATPase|nr:cadmium-translocating P-type ATPase [Oscillospiraceae bacterium]
MDNTAGRDWDDNAPACSCGHCHHDEHDETGEEASEGGLVRRYGADVIGAALYICAFFIDNAVVGTGLFVAAYLLLGRGVLMGSARSVLRLATGKDRRGSAAALLDENFLMTIATIGALAIREFPEAVAVVLLYRIGEELQERAVRSSKRSIRALMDLRPDSVNLLGEDGIVRVVAPDEVEVGQRILVRAGERIPLDGIVVEGECELDTAALTGESQPRAIAAGGEALSGSIVIGGVLTVEVSRVARESTVARILEMTQKAASRKTVAELLISSFAKVYTPIVVGAAVVMAVAPALLGMDISESVRRALVFLVISCPCALVVSIPLGYFAGLGAASRRGVLVKGARYLEAMSKVDMVVFDKTGTLTKGEFEIERVDVAAAAGAGAWGDGDEMRVLEVAAYAEWDSSHPIARSIKAEWVGRGGVFVPGRLAERYERAGFGVRVKLDGKEVLAGSARLLDEAGIGKVGVRDREAETAVEVAVDGKYLGRITLRDAIKEDAREAVRMLRGLGVREIAMLTGDNAAAAEVVKAELGLDRVEAGLLPNQKMESLERSMKAKSGKGTVVFVGDGINDAPVLARADVGIAMGALGSDAALEAADAALMTDEPARVAELIRIARKTRRIGIENIALSLGVKAVLMAFGALGLTPLPLAVFGDMGVTLLAVANAMRVGRASRASRA